MINQLTLSKLRLATIIMCSSEKAAMTFQVSKTITRERSIIFLQIHELSQRQRILTCDLLAELIVCVCVCANEDIQSNLLPADLITSNPLAKIPSG